MKIIDLARQATEFDEDNSAPAFSQEDLALQFAARHHGELRYVDAWKWWLLWDGKRWHHDETRNTFSMARRLCREFAGRLNKSKDARDIASAKTRAAVVSLAGEDRRIAATVDQWDTDLWLLNTPGGVVDLRTGSVRAHRPEDYMTKLTAVAPDAACPTPGWFAFLKKVTDADVELESYLQRMCGYALTGSTREHALFFLYGGGGNGKSDLLSTAAGVLGEYSKIAPIETFTATNHDRHPTELAKLRGARLVTAIETEAGRQWAEARIKALTGGDKITARFMRQDFFEYIPQFKLLIAGNNKPGLRSVDEAMKRRFNLIPFEVNIPKDERDLELAEKLKGEWPGILAWMVTGCLAWQQKGLAPPNVVVAATEAYLESEDTFNQWLEECCRVGASEWCALADLFFVHKKWAAAANIDAGTEKALGNQLATRFKRAKRGRGSPRGFIGLTVFKPQTEPQNGEAPKKAEPIWVAPF